jgi:uncharacterized protein (TIGR02996 family)
MTTPEHLSAIIADPDNDTPRLVYADRLEKQGDPRGEFIRVQCELARSPKQKKRRAKLEAQETGLLNAYGQQWRDALLPPNLPTPKDRTWDYIRSVRFQRGFVEAIELSIPGLLKISDTVFRLCCVARDVPAASS